MNYLVIWTIVHKVTEQDISIRIKIEGRRRRCILWDDVVERFTEVQKLLIIIINNKCKEVKGGREKERENGEEDEPGKYYRSI